MLAEELRLGATRQQIAVIRALADEFERCLLRTGAVQTLREQLVHELARLGCQSLETAAAMAKKPDVEDESGLLPAERARHAHERRDTEVGAAPPARAERTRTGMLAP